MPFDAEHLYNLLPSVYRVRDSEQGDALKELVAVLAGEVAAVIEEDLAQLYGDQFIETCADWVVPYIGDLIGYRSLYGVVPRISSPRAEVTNTIGFRRRRGTVSMREQLARDVTDWDARVVEFFSLLATTQHVQHIRPANLALPCNAHHRAVHGGRYRVRRTAQGGVPFPPGGSHRPRTHPGGPQHQGHDQP